MRHLLILTAAAMLIALSPSAPEAQRGGASPFSEFHKQSELAIGKPAPRLHLQDANGTERDLRDYLGRYVFIEFGSYT